MTMNFSSTYSPNPPSIQTGESFSSLIKLSIRIDRFDEKNENAQSSWMRKFLSKTLLSIIEEKFSRDNLSRIIFLLIYLSVSIGLVIFVIIYRVDQGLHWLEIVARICGMQLNFNCMMMIFLMLRYTMGLIRRNRILYSLVPVDDAISIHKMLGRWIVVLVLNHALFHDLFRYGRHR